MRKHQTLLRIFIVFMMLINLSACTKAPSENIEKIEVIENYINNDYQYLSFSFTGKDGNKYDCLITGLTLGKDNASEEYAKMVNDMKEQLAIGKRFLVKDDKEFIDTYGLEIVPIDAEKINKVTSNQHQLCWAASASDMLQYTGWASKTTNPKTNTSFKNEDEIFDYYIDNFEDKTGSQYCGIKWFFNGINVLENMNQAANLNTAPSQGLLKDYPAETLMERYAPSYYPDNNSYGSMIINALDSGCGVGLLIDSFVIDYGDKEKGSYDGSHCVSCFGYVKDANTGKLAALFIADSDNDASAIENESDMVGDDNGLMPDGLTYDKTKRTNKLTMFPIGDFTVDFFDVGGDTLNYKHGYTPTQGGTNVGSQNVLELVDYYKGHECETIISRVEMLYPYSIALASNVDSGSKDALKNIDLSIDESYIVDEELKAVSLVKKDTPLSFVVSVNNYSMAQPLVTGSYFTYAIEATDINNQTLTFEGIYKFLPSAIECGYSLGNSMINTNFSVEKAGMYNITFKITGIYDALGNKVEEAYLNNNVSQAHYLTVTD